MIAIVWEEYEQKKVTSLSKSDLLDIWRPRCDDYDNWEMFHYFGKLCKTIPKINRCA